MIHEDNGYGELSSFATASSARCLGVSQFNASHGAFLSRMRTSEHPLTQGIYEEILCSAEREKCTSRPCSAPPLLTHWIQNTLRVLHPACYFCHHHYPLTTSESFGSNRLCSKMSPDEQNSFAYTHSSVAPAESGHAYQSTQTSTALYGAPLQAASRGMYSQQRHHGMYPPYDDIPGDSQLQRQGHHSNDFLQDPGRTAFDGMPVPGATRYYDQGSVTMMQTPQMSDFSLDGHTCYQNSSREAYGIGPLQSPETAHLASARGTTVSLGRPQVKVYDGLYRSSSGTETVAVEGYTADDGGGGPADGGSDSENWDFGIPSDKSKDTRLNQNRRNLLNGLLLRYRNPDARPVQRGPGRQVESRQQSRWSDNTLSTFRRDIQQYADTKTLTPGLRNTIISQEQTDQAARTAWHRFRRAKEHREKSTHARVFKAVATELAGCEADSPYDEKCKALQAEMKSDKSVKDEVLERLKEEIHHSKSADSVTHT